MDQYSMTLDVIDSDLEPSVANVRWSDLLITSSFEELAYDCPVVPLVVVLVDQLASRRSATVDMYDELHLFLALLIE